MFYIQYKDGLVSYDYLETDGFHTVYTKQFNNAFTHTDLESLKDYVNYMNNRFNCQYKAIDEETAKTMLYPWKIDLNI